MIAPLPLTEIRRRTAALIEQEQARGPDRAARPRLSGDRNQCPACGLPFNSTKAFDKHRTGPFGSGRTPAARTCLLPHEMRALGMQPDAPGYWIVRPMSDAVRQTMRQGVAS